MKHYVSFITISILCSLFLCAGCLVVEVPAEPKNDLETRKDLFAQSWQLVNAQYNGVTDSTLPWAKTRYIRFYTDGTFAVSFLNNSSYEEGTWTMEDDGAEVVLRWKRYTTPGFKETQTWDLLDVTPERLEMRRMDPFGSSPRTTLYVFRRYNTLH